jgi:hypothetical protein
MQSSNETVKNCNPLSAHPSPTQSLQQVRRHISSKGLILEVGIAGLQTEHVGSGNLVHNLHACAWGRHTLDPYDWAIRFETMAREMMVAGEYQPLIDYEGLGCEAVLSIPTPDHYLPLLYVLRDPAGPLTPTECNRFEQGGKIHWLQMDEFLYFSLLAGNSKAGKGGSIWKVVPSSKASLLILQRRANKSIHFVIPELGKTWTSNSLSAFAIPA